MDQFEYAPQGLIGLLTPQGNQTVEPEFGVLVPPEIGILTARMTGPGSDMAQRLVAYFETLEDTVGRFGAAPLRAVAVACTGSSYLLGRERLEQVVRAAAERARAPVFTAAGAIIYALAALQVRRMVLVSPYPDFLTDASMAWWQAHGLTVTSVVRPRAKDEGHHAIYSLRTADVLAAVEGLAPGDAEAVLFTGTGMPTLRVLPGVSARLGLPCLSSNLCLAWQAVTHLKGQQPGRDSLMPWLDSAAPWQQRLAARYPHTE